MKNIYRLYSGVYYAIFSSIMLYSAIHFRNFSSMNGIHRAVIYPVFTVAYPISCTMSSINNGLFFFRDFIHYKSDIERYREMLNQNERLNLENAILKKDVEELLSVTKLESNTQFKYIYAKARQYFDNAIVEYIEIDKGAKDGVHEGMPVIHDGFFIGRIFDVSDGRSFVILLTDVRSSVPAYTEKSNVLGLVIGDGTSIAFEPMSEDDAHKISDGEMLLTSNINNILPNNIKIGAIKSDWSIESNVGQIEYLTIVSK